MSRDDIIRMAREANILEPVDLLESNQWRQDTIRELERFAALVAERDTALLRQALTVFRMLEDTPCGDKATMEAALRERLGETK